MCRCDRSRRAHRLPTDPDELRRTLGCGSPCDASATPTAAVLDRFDLARIAELTDRVYRRVAAGTSERQPTSQQEKG